jgi:hypothetical protein
MQDDSAGADRGRLTVPPFSSRAKDLALLIAEQDADLWHLAGSMVRAERNHVPMEQTECKLGAISQIDYLCFH